ncbi:unnamed protein product [Malus baccata var. baccata]
MTDLGLLHHFLGIRVVQIEIGIFIHQGKYAKTLLEKFGLKDCKHVSTPFHSNVKLCKADGTELVDSNHYRSIVVSLLYLSATKPDIIDWGGSEDDMKSTSGYAFTFGSGAFSWAFVKQKSVAISTAEAKYVSAAEATSQAIWLRFILKDFGEMQVDSTPTMCDNMFSINNDQKSCVPSHWTHIRSEVYGLDEQQHICNLKDNVLKVVAR